MTAREVCNRLRREGWSERPGKGAHIVFKLAGHPRVIVSNHTGDIAPGTLRSICDAAGWDFPLER